MFSATIENRGGTRCFASTKDSAFVMDTAGGGANPIDTLLASLAGCLNHMVCDFFREHRLASDGFAIRAEAPLTEDNSRLANIAVSVDLKGSAIAREKEAELIAYMEQCKIFRTLSANSKISIALKRAH